MDPIRDTILENPITIRRDMDTSPQKTFDVAILGGGVIGSSTAYFLLKEDPHLSVCVIEPDPIYEYASALRSSGGCRVQFTGEENIAMSLFSIDFIKNFESLSLAKSSVAKWPVLPTPEDP